MRKPLFSVIIPALNEEKFLPKLLTSLASQTKKNFEVIVVDGHSKDATIPVAKSFAKRLPSLRVLMSKKRGPSIQRNLGAQAAKGEWLVFVDADGVFMPYFIESCISFIRDHRPTVFTTWFKPDSEVPGDAVLILLSNVMYESSLLFHRPYVTPGPLTILSRAAYDAVGGYDEEHTFSEDVDLGLRLNKAGYKSSILRETLCVYSMRRWRREGTLKILQTYAKAAVGVLVTKRAPKSMDGYILGGHLYNRKKPIKTSMLKVYERKLKQLMREIF